MINKPPPFKGLDTRVPIIIRDRKGKGFIQQGSGLGFKESWGLLVILW